VDTPEYTLDELLISRMAREMKGEAVAGAATYCSIVAVKLAQYLYAPDLIDFNSGLHHFDSRTPATMVSSEYLGKAGRKGRMCWEELFAAVFRQKFLIWVGAVQVDQFGNANISVVGQWENPKVALVGARGLPDDSVHLQAMNYHVVDHSKRSFVGQVDFVCSVGYGEARKKAGVRDGLPGIVVSNLGIFDFAPESGRMRIQSLHPGVALEDVKKNTGFELLAPSVIPQTAAPTREELDLIRTQIDPLGLRVMDRIPRAKAGEYLAQVLKKEKELFQTV